MKRQDHKNTYFFEIENDKTKSVYTKEVLGKLPEWFGNKQAINEYARNVGGHPYWAAFNEEKDKCIGFFSVKIHYAHTGEIFVCGILPEYQHKGIGKALYNMVEEYFVKSGCRYAVVKTLSDVVEFEPYKRTRKFYTSIGFQPLITLTEMWDEKNPCLIMLKTFD